MQIARGIGRSFDGHEGERLIRITLASPDEMFVGPSLTGLEVSSGDPDWDKAGRWMGESGCERVLRALADWPHAGCVLIRREGDGHLDLGELQVRVRAWCDARIMRSSQQIRLLRRIGIRTLVWSLVMLGLALGLSWSLQSEALLGPPGPLRLILSEALVIAGWVMMWRPVELLFCEPMRPAYERRLLRRLRDLRWRADSD